MIISQCLSFTASLNRRKLMKDETKIKIVRKFIRLIVLFPK